MVPLLLYWDLKWLVGVSFGPRDLVMVFVVFVWFFGCRMVVFGVSWSFM